KPLPPGLLHPCSAVWVARALLEGDRLCLDGSLSSLSFHVRPQAKYKREAHRSVVLSRSRGSLWDIASAARIPADACQPDDANNRSQERLDVASLGRLRPANDLAG